MTDPRKSPELKSVSLRLHCGKHSTAWSVVYRTSQGRDVFDRRVSAGVLPGSRPVVGPSTVVQALEAALDDMRARYGLPPAAGGPGAPGGVGGRPGPSHEGYPPTLPLSVVRDDP